MVVDIYEGDGRGDNMRLVAAQVDWEGFCEEHRDNPWDGDEILSKTKELLEEGVTWDGGGAAATFKYVLVALGFDWNRKREGQ
jgi:hypothetical protein